MEKYWIWCVVETVHNPVKSFREDCRWAFKTLPSNTAYLSFLNGFATYRHTYRLFMFFEVLWCWNGIYEKSPNFDRKANMNLCSGWWKCVATKPSNTLSVARTLISIHCHNALHSRCISIYNVGVMLRCAINLLGTANTLQGKCWPQNRTDVIDSGVKYT